ncbi:hypothetical protein [Salmonella enterica]|uniref:hypothetical protein n=1 Tax=Salmonella enterica TaxID=28901 RepID=UPI003F4AFC05
MSGAQATTVFREARVLSNRFTMLADAAPQIKDGLAFNVVAKGDSARGAAGQRHPVRHAGITPDVGSHR